MRNKRTKKLLWIFKDVYKLSVKLHELGTYAHPYLQQFCTRRKKNLMCIDFSTTGLFNQV